MTLPIASPKLTPRQELLKSLPPPPVAIEYYRPGVGCLLTTITIIMIITVSLVIFVIIIIAISMIVSIIIIMIVVIIIVRLEYYRGPDFYLFDKFQTALNAEGKIRRPPCSVTISLCLSLSLSVYIYIYIILYYASLYDSILVLYYTMYRCVCVFIYIYIYVVCMCIYIYIYIYI